MQNPQVKEGQLNTKTLKHLYSFFILVALISCESKSLERIVVFENPGSELGSEPNLHLAQDGRILLSWIQATDTKNSKLFLSALNEKKRTWSDPVLIAEGSDWFVNWADFPSITSFGENSLAAHYLDKSGEDTYAYNVKLRISNDNGITWNRAIIPHNDGTNTEHGFVSKLALEDDKLLSVWLDGRKYAYSEQDSLIAKEMTLRSAIMDTSGEILTEFELDDRVCDCCQTDTAMTQKGPIVVYRDRSETEIRDIYYVRFTDNEWTIPKPVHTDGWSIFGCPVNGPAISALENNVAVAWFTNANDIPQVKVSFSNTNGELFLTPIEVDQIKPSGRVDIELLEDGSALVSWLDNMDGIAVIRLQRIKADGHKDPAINVSESSESRSSGFPRMVLKNNKAYVTWTNAGDTLTVRTAVVNLK